MILSNLSTPLLGLVDTAVLGHLPEANHLAAVALGASIITFIFWSFGFLRMGTTSFVARAFGANDYLRAHAILARSIELALVLSLHAMALLWLLLPWLLERLTQPGEVRDLALHYCQIRLFSAPATLFNYVLVGWFVGNQNTRVPLLLMVMLNICNIVLDLILVWRLGFGSAGAAVASVVAEYLCAGCGMALIARSGFFQINRQTHKRHRWRQYRELFAVNGHLFIRTAALLSVFLFFTVQGARMGAVVLAANAILQQLISMISYGLDGFAHAAEALVGRATGARNQVLFHRAVRYTALWSLLTALATTVLLAVLGPGVIDWFTDIAEVAATAQAYYGWLVFYPLLAMTAYQLDGVLLGWGRADLMQVGMLISALGVFLPLWWLGEGNSGLWVAFIVFNVSRGVILALLLLPKLRRGALWQN